MDTEASNYPAPKYSANPLVVLIISLSAAIVVAGGFGIVIEAAILALANLFALGTGFVYMASAANALATIWLALWTFARSWHVERRLRDGLEVDEPKLSILANFRG